MAGNLRARLGYCPASVDTGDAGIIANHDNTLRLASRNKPDADWLIAIEDDADPVLDFYKQAEQALAHCPTPVASLYFGYVGQRRRSTNLLLALRDPHWIMCRGLMSAVCLAVHRTVLDALLAAAECHTDMTVDERYSAATRDIDTGIWVAHSNPSLVNHLDPGTVSDGGGKPDIERKAYQVGVRDTWNGKHQRLHHKIWGH
jgi:hypothetical protein